MAEERRLPSRKAIAEANRRTASSRELLDKQNGWKDEEEEEEEEDEWGEEEEVMES